MLHHLLLELALRLQPKLFVLALGPPGSLPELASLLDSTGAPLARTGGLLGGA
jgi:hypothetical protein